MEQDKELLERMLKKTVELFEQIKLDRYICGNGYIEFGERHIKVIDPADVIIKFPNASKKDIKKFKRELKKCDKSKKEKTVM